MHQLNKWKQCHVCSVSIIVSMDCMVPHIMSTDNNTHSQKWAWFHVNSCVYTTVFPSVQLSLLLSLMVRSRYSIKQMWPTGRIMTWIIRITHYNAAPIKPCQTLYRSFVLLYSLDSYEIFLSIEWYTGSHELVNGVHCVHLQIQLYIY